MNMHTDASAVALVKLISESPILVMIKKTCSYCARAMDYIKDNGYGDVVKRIDAEEEEGSKQREILQERLKYSKVPMVFIRGRFIGGCDSVTKEGVLRQSMEQPALPESEVAKSLGIQMP